MSLNYVKNNLAKDEKVLLSATTSPLIVWLWIVIWMLPTLICFMLDIAALGVVFGLITIIVYLHYKAIEMVITNKRILLTKGIIVTNTDEIRLEKCESTSLSKGLLGVIFNYGDIIFTGTGSSVLTWKNISDPKDIRKKIEDIFETYGKR